MPLFKFGKSLPENQLRFCLYLLKEYKIWFLVDCKGKVFYFE
jgi:hypothetical protein